MTTSSSVRSVNSFRILKLACLLSLLAFTALMLRVGNEKIPIYLRLLPQGELLAESLAKKHFRGTFRQEDLDGWKKAVRKETKLFCASNDKDGRRCLGGYTLDYARSFNESESDVFLHSGLSCPPAFVKGRIYTCNRYAGEWRNRLRRNKRAQLIAYEKFEKEVKLKASETNSLKDLDCPDGDLNSRLFDLNNDLKLQNLTSLYPPLWTFYPETHAVSQRSDAEKVERNFRNRLLSKDLKASDMFTIKSNKEHKGKGIEIMNVEHILKRLQRYDSEEHTYVVQKFIEPFLWDGTKFQIRTWAIVFNEDPLMVTGHIGHIAVAAQPYDENRYGNWLYSKLTNLRPPAEQWNKSEFLRHFRGFPEFVEYVESLGGNFGPKNYEEMISAMMDSMRFTMSATHTIPEEYIFPKTSWSPRYRREAVETTGWKDTTFITKICFDWILSSEGTIFLTEENHSCGEPGKFGSNRKFHSSARDFNPQWKIDLTAGLNVKSLEIAEEIFFRKVNGLPFGFTNLSTPLESHVPLIDESNMIHLERKDRAYCHQKLYNTDQDLVMRAHNTHYQYFKFSDYSLATDKEFEAKSI